ncbi:hypothetical protein D3Y55_29955 [Mesorhizobium sp. DCY119]|nr:hypothetical protein D3Y55_29955 [Mesorhizobium sp. DCY119]
MGILQTRLGTIDSEEKFAAFVNEAERAFSHEHTQWVAPQIDNAPYISRKLRKLREIIGGDDNEHSSIMFIMRLMHVAAI